MPFGEPRDRVASISAFFEPRSVAVVGASPRESSGGHRIFRNLVRLCDGPVYPVHPSADEILGHRCHRSIGELPEPVDLAVIFVPSAQIPPIVEDCIAAGVKAVCVEAGGFADAGAEGARLQQRLTELADGSATRLWGPNCAGYVSTKPLLSTAFVDLPDSMPAGATSLIFQSGMAAAALLAEIASRGLMSIDKACSIGNKVDVDEADLLGYLATQGTSETVALYLESIVDGQRFARSLDALVPEATVVALMGNRTASGLEAAATHTGAVLAQSDGIGSFLRHHGVVEAEDFTELVELTRAYEVTGPRVGGPNVAVLTFSGAAGVVAADLLEASGMRLAKLSEQTMAELSSVFPNWYQPANPVDVWSTVEQRGFAEATGRTITALLADEEVDAVLFVPLAFDHYGSDDIAEFAMAAGQTPKPVVTWPIGDADVVSEWAPLLEKAGVPICSGLGSAVKVLAGLETRSESLERRRLVEATPAKETSSAWPEWVEEHRGGSLGEVDAKRLMAIFGVGVVEEVVVESAAAAEDAATRLGYPVALKLAAEALSHKSDIGGVLLDVADGTAVRSGFERLLATAADADLSGPKVVVQPMVRDGVEMIVGARRDPSLGWLVVVGTGGVDVESLADVAIRPAPVSRADARAMVGELRGVSVLESGRRGRADVDSLVDAIVSVSDMTRDAPSRVAAIEANPLLVGRAGRGAVAVDGLVTFEENGPSGETERLSGH